VGPDYTPPEPETSDAWQQDLTRGLESGQSNLDTWWTELGDPTLDRLIEKASAGNLDLHEAFARILEARATFGIATGQFFPDVDGIGTYQRSRLSEESSSFIPPGTSRTDDSFQAGFDTSWEVDIFGRIRRSVESADASLAASVETFRDVRVVLNAEVARNYIEARTLQARIRLALANVQIQSDTLQLTRDKLAAELIPQLDVRQAELNVATTEAFVPTLRILLSQTIHRLSVLLGELPGALYDELAQAGPLPRVPTEITVGVPANLLRQRPDLRAAERELAAQVARIGVATADLYPRFTLVGTFALEASDFGRMWDQGARAYSMGPSVRWNLFDGGRIRSNIHVENARAKQALVRYEKAVLVAQEEVENALVAYAQEVERREALTRAVTAAESSVELVTTLYNTGVIDFQNVLDTQRSLFQQQDQLAASRGNVLQEVIRLYKALGGGWSPNPPQSPDPPQKDEGSSESGAAS